MATSPALAIPDQPIFAAPKVLLIGDSISFGYAADVQKRLGDKAVVYRLQGSVAATVSGALRLDTSNGLKEIDSWLKAGDWRVIHFNWGLHDVKIEKDGAHQVELDAYETNLRELVGKLRQTGAALIWASTTPIPDGNLAPPRRAGDEVTYNHIAAGIMAENGIPTNDLHFYALARLSEIQRPENVHFTDEGSACLAIPGAQHIENALEA